MKHNSNIINVGLIKGRHEIAAVEEYIFNDVIKTELRSAHSVAAPRGNGWFCKNCGST